MTVLPDAVRAYEQELLQKADMLALGLKGLRAAAPERAAELLEDITARLEVAMVQDGTSPVVHRGTDERSRAEPRRMTPVVVAARGGGADEMKILTSDIRAKNRTGRSVRIS